MATPLTLTTILLLSIMDVLSYNLTVHIEDNEVRKLTSEFISLCPKTLLCKIDDINNNSTSNYRGNGQCCSLCSCSEKCHEIGDCCPDMLYTIPPVVRTTPTTSKCVNLVYGNDGYVEHGYMVIAGCPYTNDNYDLARKCTQEYIQYDFKDGLVGLLPVIDLETEKTYKNIYCLRCNGGNEERLHYYDLIDSCIYDYPILTPTIEMMFSQRLSKCTPTFQHSTTTPVKHPKPCQTYLTDECNSTGTQLVEDSRLEKYCHAYTNKFRQYRNVHCALCNGVPSKEIKETKCDYLTNGRVQDSTINTKGLIALETTNSFSEITKELFSNRAFTNCTQVNDVNERLTETHPCVARHCPKYYFLYQMFCLPLYTSAVWFPVQLRFRFYPSHNVRLDDPTLQSLQETVENELNNEAQNIDISVLCRRVAFDLYMKVDVETTTFTDRNIGHTTESPAIVYIDIHVYVLYTQVRNVHNYINRLQSLNYLKFGLNKRYQKEFVGEHADIILYGTESLPASPIQLTAKQTQIFGTSQALEDTDGKLILMFRWDGVSIAKSVHIHPISTCSQIVLDSTRFDRNVNDNGRIHVRVLNKSVDLSDAVFTTDYSHMLMCEDLYNELQQQEDTESTPYPRMRVVKGKPVYGRNDCNQESSSKVLLAATLIIIYI